MTAGGDPLLGQLGIPPASICTLPPSISTLPPLQFAEKKKEVELTVWHLQPIQTTAS